MINWSSYIYTYTQLAQIKQEIDILRDSLYLISNDSFEKTIDEKIRFWSAQIIKEELAKSKEDHKLFFDEMSHELSLFKVLQLQLAFEPTTRQMAVLCSKAQEIFGQVVLDCVYNPGIIGGVILSWDGVYQDYSLKKRLVSYFAKNYQNENI